jgi:uncharacterized protein involved in exopolysaccharide biosynthesis
MTNFELLKQLAKRLKKYSWVMLLAGVLFAVLFFFMAKQSVVNYTAKSTVFPLNSTNDNTISTSAISNILGLADAPKSFSSEAAINIVELATSRRTREAVATTRVPSLKNKTIAEVLLEEHNKHTGFMQNEAIKLPDDSALLVNMASDMLVGTFNAKINKNGILELYYTNSNTEIVKEVSYTFVQKISEFYTDLKKKKAQVDYEFAVKKADSLKQVLSSLDERAVKLDESTFFTNEELKRFRLPKVNLEQDKQTVQSQYYYAVNNREAAAYKLQKETPIIEMLDKPEGPYTRTSKSPKLYAIIGAILGLVLGAIAVSWKVINQYIGVELNKALEKAAQPKNTETAPAAPQA